MFLGSTMPAGGQLQPCHQTNELEYKQTCCLQYTLPASTVSSCSSVQTGRVSLLAACTPLKYEEPSVTRTSWLCEEPKLHAAGALVLPGGQRRAAFCCAQGR